MACMQDLVWDILETEACEQYFIDSAKKPAFLLLSKFNPLAHGKFELYMNHVAKIGDFTSKKKAEDKLKEAIAKAKKPIKVYKVSRWAFKKSKRKFFAEKVGVGGRGN